MKKDGIEKGSFVDQLIDTYEDIVIVNKKGQDALASVWYENEPVDDRKRE